MERHKTWFLLASLTLAFSFGAGGWLSARADINSGLTALYKFNEGSGTTLNDSSGNGYNGGSIATSWTTNQNGGNALSFDGANGRVIINNAGLIGSASTTFTIAGWINTARNGGANGNGIFMVGFPSSAFPSTGISLVLGSGAPFATNGLGFYYKCNAGTFSNANAFSLNTWEHVAVTFNSGTVTFYVNGAAAGSASGVTGGSCTLGDPTQYGTNIGAYLNTQDSSRFFQGSMDEVRLYPTSLSPTDILTLYNQGLATIPSITEQTVTGIGPTSATLHGTLVNDNSASTTILGFNYGTTISYGSNASSTGSFVNGNTFSQTISGLSCNTLYHTQAFGVNYAGTGTSTPDLTFTTGACAPSVSAQSASSITSSAATLNGSIDNTGGANPTLRGFEFGPTAAYGSIISSSGSFSSGAFTGSESGLTCGTTYHYRSFAVNSTGNASSSDQTFSTSACPVAQSSSSVMPSGDRAAFLETIYRQNGLTCPASLCGPLTTAAQPDAPLAAPASAPAQSFTRYLQAGMSGSDVKALQIFLNAHGFPVASFGAGSPGHETTLFGNATKAALKRFQAANHISATGYFGPVTLKAVSEK